MGFSGGGMRFFLQIKILVLLVLITGCGALNKFADLDSSCGSGTPIAGAANLSLFLNINRMGANTNVTLKISSVELLVDDLWVPFSTNLSEVNSADIRYVQKFLNREWLKGRICRGIRVKATAGTTPRTGNTSSDLQVVNLDTELILQHPIDLEPDSRKVMFIEWNPGKSISNTDQKEASLVAYSGSSSRIATNLVYVACPEIDTIYVVRADKFQVVDAFAVKGKPNYLSVDSDNKRIYVLSENLNKIIPFDIFTLTPGNEIIVSLANLPKFMMVKNSNQIAYVLDAQGVLTSIDLATGNMVNRNRIGNGPNYICYIPGFNKLAVSSTFDQTVYFVNPDTLAIEDTIALTSPPLGLISWKNYLYIAEGQTNSVSIYDLSSRKILKNVHVGFAPSRFISTSNSVYVSNSGDGTISIIQGEQFSVSKDVTIGKSAREMVVSEKQRLLFVGEGDCLGSLVVVDSTANQIIGRVELGAKPVGIAVLD